MIMLCCPVCGDACTQEFAKGTRIIDPLWCGACQTYRRQAVCRQVVVGDRVGMCNARRWYPDSTCTGERIIDGYSRDYMTTRCTGCRRGGTYGFGAMVEPYPA